jgi:hypothetical protein
MIYALRLADLFPGDQAAEQLIKAAGKQMPGF